MSPSMKPDDEFLDVRSEKRKRREASVNSWKQLDEHWGLLGRPPGYKPGYVK